MTTRLFWATMLATTWLCPALVLADGPLPTDPDVIAGDVTISAPSANQLLLLQSGAYGIVDWGSFSIADGFGVQFQNGTGSTLNRVTGADVSSILGQLDATGSVYLINQNGIVFGTTGVVNTGGSFVASTLDIDNGDFLDGGDATFRGAGDGYVINLGSISALGGDVAILGRNVRNAGSLSAPNGTVGLAAGREILMRDASVADGMFAVRIGGSDTSVTESGAIRAAAAELRANGGNVYALAGNTDGMIAVTGVARAKGRVFLTAGAGGEVKVAKTVKASEADGSGGTIVVDGGRVDMAGVLDASGNSGGEVRITSAVSTVFSGQVLAFGDGTTGSGGFAEVSGRHLTFGGTVETRGGTVLIDPDNIEITNSSSALLSGASLLTPASIVALLTTQDVIIQTSSGAGEAGTIVVTDAINWTRPFSLTFLAHGDIWFNASVQGSAAAGGDLNIVAGWDGSTSTTAFDAAPFISADILTTTLFGNSNGISYSLNGVSQTASGAFFIGFASATTTAVGARAGATRLFASGGVIGFGAGFSQLGYNVESGGTGITVTGDILLRSTGNVNLIGGSTTGSAAQIGHIGINTADSAAATVEATGNITIETFNGVELDGGTAANSYAMVGHGSLDFESGMMTLGNRSGNITILANGEISIEPGAFGSGSAGWIGHATASGILSDADVTVRAFSFDQSRLSGVGVGSVGILDIAMLAAATEGGTVRFVATDAALGAELSLTGSTFNGGCRCDSINTLGDLIIQAAGDLSLDSTFLFSNTGGGNLGLVAGANFHNNSGADAIGTMTGVWRIYSTRPEDNTGDIGTFVLPFVQTGVLFNSTDPFGLPPGSVLSGSGLTYSKFPLLTIGNATMTYGGTLVLPGFTVTVDGIVADAADWGFSIDSIFVDDAVVTLSGSGNINAGTFLSALDFTWSVAPTINGYESVFFFAGDLTVNQALLTGSIIGAPTKVYDGNATAALTAANFLLDGFVAGEGATVTQTTGTYVTANANGSGPIGLSAGLSTGNVVGTGTTDMANYSIPATVSGNGEITPATLTATLIGSLTKVYDGSTFAVLTAGNYLLSGFVGADGATVSQTVGLYRGSDANLAIIVDAAELTLDDFAATGSTLLSNYFLPVTASGTGSIIQATLTATIIGTPTKVYDGAATATLTAANFLLGGFAAGEGGIVAATSGTYASANASGTNAVTVTFVEGDIQSDSSSTSLANYILPLTATGNGVISQAVLTGSIIGTPTKVYDGTAVAALTAANYLLTGFMAGEGATVSERVGSYASANASGSNLVTVVLGAGDFSATGGTLLANYVLPTTVTGNGVITQGLLVAGTIIGATTKVYDGNNVANLTAANFLLTGFVAGEGATVTATTGAYASANASGSNLITVVLSTLDFAATGSTQLSNYVLPTTVTGNGVITQAVLTGDIIGTPTKVYDGTSATTLTAANFLLTGFVGGEGATVTETAGTYASVNAAAANLVTVSLDAADFAGTGATLLANYILPTTISGTGSIDRAILTASIIGLPTKPFDGTVQATLTPANFSLIGFVAGEGAVVSQTQGTYATATAGVANTVTAALSDPDFTASGGTLLANYVLPATASGPGLVDLAPPAQPEIPQTRGLETFDTTPLGQPSGPASGIEVINSETTQRILDEIRAGSAFCKALIRQEYVIDCLSDRLQSVADGLSAVGEYSEVRAALENAAQQLHALALSNASTDLAQQVVRAAGRRSSRALTAISAAALGSANAQAAAIIETASLVLLRSSSGSEQRAVAFNQVAEVVNSTKVLLRSS